MNKMKIQSLLQIDDLRNTIIEYVNTNDTISLGKILNINFLIYHNFNVDFCTILDITKIKTTSKEIILRMGKKLTSQDLYYKYCRLNITKNDRFYRGLVRRQEEIGKTNLFELIYSSISFIFARKAIELLELNKININFNIIDLKIIDDEVLKYYKTLFESDVNKKEFCQRCGLHGHSTVSMDKCGLYDKIYSRNSYSTIARLNEVKELKQTKKFNSFDTLRLNKFIETTEEKKLKELQKASEIFSTFEADQNLELSTELHSYQLQKASELFSTFEVEQNLESSKQLFSTFEAEQNLKLSTEFQKYMQTIRDFKPVYSEYSESKYTYNSKQYICLEEYTYNSKQYICLEE
jgi:ribosomal protein S27AE